MPGPKYFEEMIKEKMSLVFLQRSVPNEEEYIYALKYSPDDWLIKYKFALFKMVTGNYSESVLALLNEVRKSVPQNPTVEFNIGFYHENRGDHQRARVHYKRAIDIFPNYGEAHKRYAQLHQH